jgi:hypothetical protein
VTNSSSPDKETACSSTRQVVSRETVSSSTDLRVFGKYSDVDLARSAVRVEVRARSSLRCGSSRGQGFTRTSRCRLRACAAVHAAVARRCSARRRCGRGLVWLHREPICECPPRGGSFGKWSKRADGKGPVRSMSSSVPPTQPEPSLNPTPDQRGGEQRTRYEALGLSLPPVLRLGIAGDLQVFGRLMISRWPLRGRLWR